MQKLRKSLRGLSEIKTPLKSKMLSRPKSKNAEYLNLYLLNKEKELNLQELSSLNKRRNQLNKNMEILDKHSGELLKGIDLEDLEVEKKELKKIVQFPPKNEELKDWKSMEIDY
ncbi:MAG: hypothetical protein HYU63_08595 [Armatimonadetes bacterium]|nr:hypothetical protein [Armatimonadota bacterium]